MNPIIQEIGLVGIVPVIAIDDATDAIPLAQALTAGGLPCAEVTFRTAAAQDAIARIASANANMLLGAGTVLTVDQVKAAVGSGAKFIVSPGLNRKVVEYCLTQDIPVTPGVATPTEVEAALEMGLDVVKFFPAEANGGLAYLKAIAAPYKTMKYIPTGGIDESNLLAYLRFASVVACGGSWMVKPELITKRRFDDIKRLAEQAISKMLGYALRSVSISCETDAAASASHIAGLFRLPLTEDHIAWKIGDQIELLKKPSTFERGCLMLGTNFVDRAIYRLTQSGLHVKQDSLVERNGRAVAVDFVEEMEGFALRLCQNP